LEMLRRWPRGSIGVSAKYLSEGCHPGGPRTNNDFSFLILPHRETAEAMAYSLSLSLLYLGLLCGTGLVSARGSELFAQGTSQPQKCVIYFTLTQQSDLQSSWSVYIQGRMIPSTLLAYVNMHQMKVFACFVSCAYCSIC